MSGPVPGSPGSYLIVTKTAEGKRSDLEKEIDAVPEKGTEAPDDKGGKEVGQKKSEKGTNEEEAK